MSVPQNDLKTMAINGTVSIKDDKIKVNDRLALWEKNAISIFDDDLDKLKNLIVTVFTTDDPSLELEKNKRVFAGLYDKVSKYSPEIRLGLAETVAILGIYPELLKNCSRNKRNNIASEIVLEIFHNADWKRWAGLSSYLNCFAEGAPEAYLGAIEKLLSTPKEFCRIQEEEGDILFGQYYLTGIVTALEILAWNEIYFARAVNALSSLASLDKGGNIHPRPADSLIHIFLPWLPQTLACAEKRIAIAKVLMKSNPIIAWSAISSLLPRSYQSSTGTHHPVWTPIAIPDNSKMKVSGKEYYRDVVSYENILLEKAKEDPSYAEKLVPLLDGLTPDSFSQALSVLRSSELATLPDEQKEVIWCALLRLVIRHRRYAKTDWAMDEEYINQIEEISEPLKPKSTIYQYKYLFAKERHSLFENDDYTAENERLLKEEFKAVEKIYTEGKLPLIVNFIRIVTRPHEVGFHLASLATSELDHEIITTLLESKDACISVFLKEYFSRRYEKEKIVWIETFFDTAWELSKKVSFLCYFPFSINIWQCTEELLGENEQKYWQQVPVQTWVHSDNIEFAIKKSLRYNRPALALHCFEVLCFDKLEIDFDSCTQALLESLGSDELIAMDKWQILQIIETIQPLAKTKEQIKKLQQVEFAYLPLLNNTDSDNSPVALESALATDAKFFHEMLCACYKSKNDSKEINLTDQAKRLAEHAHILLSNWHTVPGVKSDGSFDNIFFKTWLSEVLSLSTQSGRVEIAQSRIGKVLYYAPVDPNGLWIHTVIACELDQNENTDMRNGFKIEAYNSRGAHFIDTTGKEDMKLAHDFHQKASALEDAGFLTFSKVLRSLAQSYEEEAEYHKELAREK